DYYCCSYAGSYSFALF
nr:immunoglobulin light chain junction region [Macaca mulatta]MOV96276.1 immunoglobulin light chain junction region [Macaca mulatta]